MHEIKVELEKEKIIEKRQWELLIENENKNIRLFTFYEYSEEETFINNIDENTNTFFIIKVDHIIIGYISSDGKILSLLNDIENKKIKEFLKSVYNITITELIKIILNELLQKKETNMKKEISFKIEEYIITNYEQTDNGVNYELNNDENSRTLKTIYYNPVHNFISNTYGTAPLTIGKKITLISDTKRLLALKSEEGDLLFISDYQNAQGETHYFENEKYILENYGLSKEEFLSLVKERVLNKILKLTDK